MRLGWLGALSSVAGLMLMAVAPGRAAEPADVVVSAAASLTDVIPPLARMFELRTGDRVVLNFGASNTLARQILEGAPVDLFISADVVQMDLVRRAGHLDPEPPTPLLSNQLVIVVPTDRVVALTSVHVLLSSSIARIAIGDPATVPAGVYTRRYLESMHLWEALQPKLVPAGSVRMALAAAESGNADAAFVYRTDAVVSKRVRIALEIPRSETPPIVYPAAVVRVGKNPAAARRFLEFLQGPVARAAFVQAGFLTPEPSR